jgi:hypothetical protein
MGSAGKDRDADANGTRRRPERRARNASARTFFFPASREADFSIATTFGSRRERRGV